MKLKFKYKLKFLLLFWFCVRDECLITLTIKVLYLLKINKVKFYSLSVPWIFGEES